MQIVFLNENISGHATVHMNIERALSHTPEVDAEFLHVPSPKLTRRVLGAQVPGLARFDLDLQPLRLQLASAVVARRMLRHRHIERPDALHVYTQNAALLSVDILRTLPTVVTIDSTNALNAFRLPYRSPTRFTARLLPLTQSFERRVYEAATIIVANNRTAFRSLVDDYGVPEDKVRVFPLGITVSPPAARQGLPRSMPRLTFVGASLERKGGRVLLELHQRHLRERCILTLVTREAVELGMYNVEVHNDVTPGNGKLGPILADTDVFVFPSVMDQSPNAVLEAMAAGLPVVALPVAGVPEMVEDGVTGHLVPPGDERALLDAITSLLDDPTAARAMGQRGRQAVLERFDASRTTERLIDALREAVALRAGRSSAS